MFVKAILTDFWIYRDKLGQHKPSRSMLANDKLLFLIKTSSYLEAEGIR